MSVLTSFRVRWRLATTTMVVATGLITFFAGWDKHAQFTIVPKAAIGADRDNEISDPAYFGRFTSLHEPSGVVSLDATTVVAIEDEMARPLRRLKLTTDPDAESLVITELAQAPAKGFFQRQLLGPLDDLEGIARASDAQFFAIGSHDDAHKGKNSLRQKLLLFTLEGENVTSVKVQKGLYKHINSNYPLLSAKFKKAKKTPENALNIEGMAFDRKRQVLHIGLRSPRLDAAAVIVTLLNPIAYLHDKETAQFAKDLWRLELDKGGIRALTYDDVSDKLLVISQRESGKNKQFKLWSVPADNSQPPTRIRSRSKKLFDDVEGLTAIEDGILFVKDNGLLHKQRGADWFVLQRQQLGVDE